MAARKLSTARREAAFLTSRRDIILFLVRRGVVALVEHGGQLSLPCLGAASSDHTGVLTILMEVLTVIDAVAEKE